MTLQALVKCSFHGKAFWHWVSMSAKFSTYSLNDYDVNEAKIAFFLLYYINIYVYMLEKSNQSEEMYNGWKNSLNGFNLPENIQRVLFFLNNKF